MPQSKILIIDDEPDIVEVLEDRLIAAGFDVRSVLCARDGYAAVAEDAPDLILMDIQMPEISGMEALVELQKTNPEIPVLMISASTVKNVAGTAKEKGAVDFLLKPFDPDTLMEKVNEILGIG